jgi:iron complex transport system ATP-binding protein
LNRLDSDEQAASVLNIPVAREAPFSPIGGVARSACSKLIHEADLVVVTPVPLGHGNLANLYLAQEAQSDGKIVFLLGGDPGDRDFTGGAGAALWRELRESGATEFESLALLDAELARIASRESADE